MENEIRSWLSVILKDNIDNLSLHIVGNSEKGDGYVGDIIFVTLTSEKGKSNPEYSLVLKCSKRSQVLRDSAPVKEAFINEIYIYEKVLPAFTQFQTAKNIRNPFNSVPKCYGTLVTDNMEIIVFENLKSKGYTLWDKKKPLTRNHIEMVIEEYAKFHAVSIAMNDQQPEKFGQLIDGFVDIFKCFLESTDCETLFGNNVDDIHGLLKDELDDKTLDVWKSFRKQINYIFTEMIQEMNGVKVIRHGDCWCNNFMFKHDNKNNILPLEVAILDWQISVYSSPILDLSYFVFASISKDDIDDLNDILEQYYEKLKFYTTQLGSNLDVLYPKQEFLNDWRKYCKFGILMSSLVFKICATEKDEVLDIADAAESGNDFGKAFDYEVKNKSALKNRAKYVVQYVVKNNLI
ncbi:hypothetical protein Zmor_001798 [Zophobas morio]|uniref:CHK kinase-like domain-containing protein n=2 Tax=Zophobas morio TaxID=2755281 RepID=A0AA38MSZ0_9CUCU|nr:hypothetical protein Zmor_001798 [Zophobas morio]